MILENYITYAIHVSHNIKHNNEHKCKIEVKSPYHEFKITINSNLLIETKF